MCYWLQVYYAILFSSIVNKTMKHIVAFTTSMYFITVLNRFLLVQNIPFLQIGAAAAVTQRKKRDENKCLCIPFCIFMGCHIYVYESQLNL